MTRDVLMLKADQLACRAYNTASVIRNNPTKRIRAILKRNLELKDIGRGEACFIFGNGPSLKDIDVDLIKDYTIFTVNYFFKGSVKIEPRYHVMIDPIFFEKEFDHMHELVRQHKDTRFILPTEIMQNPKFRKMNEKEKGRIYFVQIGLKTYSEFIRFDMTRKMTVSMNVLPFTIQCALYMGFTEIYLLGYEFGLYAPVATGHFYDPANEVTKPSDVAENLIKGAIVQRHNWAIAQYCKKNDIVIRNLTPESYIKAYPMQDLYGTVLDLEKRNEKDFHNHHHL